MKKVIPALTIIFMINTAFSYEISSDYYSIPISEPIRPIMTSDHSYNKLRLELYDRQMQDYNNTIQRENERRMKALQDRIDKLEKEQHYQYRY